MRLIASLALTFALATGFTSAADDDQKKDSVTHVDASKATTLLAEKDKAEKPVILDIRTPEEFAGGHLEGAKNIDFNAESFAEELAKLDKSKPYLVHCRSGGRSGRSLATFEKLGFTKIYHLDGGILAWEKAKLPVVK